MTYACKRRCATLDGQKRRRASTQLRVPSCALDGAEPQSGVRGAAELGARAAAEAARHAPVCGSRGSRATHVAHIPGPCPLTSRCIFGSTGRRGQAATVGEDADGDADGPSVEDAPRQPPSAEAAHRPLAWDARPPRREAKPTCLTHPRSCSWSSSGSDLSRSICPQQTLFAADPVRSGPLLGWGVRFTKPGRRFPTPLRDQG